MEEVKSDGESIFNCLIHGDLFDVVDQKWMVGKAQDGEPPGVEALDRPPMPAAPKGCVFRQINPPDSEVTCDITGAQSGLCCPYLRADMCLPYRSRR